MRYIFLSLLLLVLPCHADAAPSVTGVGTIAHGASVTVSGSSFGTKATAAPIRWDNFETGTVGHDVTTDFDWWSKTTNTPSILISNSKSRGTSTKSIEHYLKAGLESSTETGVVVSILYRNAVGFTSTGKILVSFWTYWDWGTTYVQNGGTNLNYAQIKELDLPVAVNATGQPTFPLLEYIHWVYALDGTPYVHTYQQEYYNGTSTGSQNVEIKSSGSWVDTPRTPGWYHVTMQVDMGTAGTANGSRKIWNSAVGFSAPYYINSTTNDMVLGDADNTNRIDAFKLGWYRGYTNQGESYIYHDDIYIDNSWARVEIGDASTYDSCTHREIQIPSAWSATEITATVNLGSFTAGQTVYLFVIDEDGTPSAGYGPIVLGGAVVSKLSGGGKLTGGTIR